MSEALFEENIKGVAQKINKIKKTSDISILNHNLIKINNFSKVVNLIPSIIDYAINIGLKETSQQWINLLLHDESLTSNIYMKSILDDYIDVEKKFLNFNVHI